MKITAVTGASNHVGDAQGGLATAVGKDNRGGGLGGLLGVLGTLGGDLDATGSGSDVNGLPSKETSSSLFSPFARN